MTLGTRRLDRAVRFYDAVLSPLGLGRLVTGDSAAGFGRDGRPQFWIVVPFDGGEASVGNGTHVAFLAPSRPAVDRFHAAALAEGGSDEGRPGLRPHYHENYYGAYVRDLDGNKIQAVCHDPA